MPPTLGWDLVAEGLCSAWSEVGGLGMHARVSTPTPARDAPAIVLVHGIGVSGRYLMPTAMRLTSTCRVYVPDLPAFALSAKPAAALGVPALADALAAWMRVVGLPPATLPRHLFGCPILAAVGGGAPCPL